MTRRRRRRGATRGLSLVEVLVAMGVLTLMLLGLAASTATSVQVSELMQERRSAMSQAQAVLTRILTDPQLPTTYSDATGSPRKAVYDLAADLGEAAPPRLVEWSGTLELDSYQFGQPAVGPPGAWRGFAAPKPFIWSEGDFFAATVTVRWRPALHVRTGQGGSIEVQVRSLYYPPPSSP